MFGTIAAQVDRVGSVAVRNGSGTTETSAGPLPAAQTSFDIRIAQRTKGGRPKRRCSDTDHDAAVSSRSGATVAAAARSSEHSRKSRSAPAAAQYRFCRLTRRSVRWHTAMASAGNRRVEDAVGPIAAVFALSSVMMQAAYKLSEHADICDRLDRDGRLALPRHLRQRARCTSKTQRVRSFDSRRSMSTR
ncbi:hypothetical protein K437DRAFT_143361 [Tilletiaria anomala UBC 951]|uniref:Uncharacterized protein n=1 Tax=Tilletiaria anomala (strain ATCC 24038 / CBS 436.72 / UBC 951) TaxID=1037660 RepID=A0A066VUJ4_TILAU|nr:uncharacterized protein K437DRAFT_143361 [Tilletiaria anomala UBC 951]KDN43938.1 hypothetical protein K437DRAFT_143361 [Tilletiaria anomala UBC 951]